MRILFLTSVYPSLVGGEKLRPYHIIKHLSRNHEVKLLCLCDGKDSDAGDLAVNSEHVRFSKIGSWVRCIRGLFSGLPIQVSYFYRGLMKKAICRELKEKRYDLIFCHLIRMSEYVKDIADTPKVLDICDALSLRYSRSHRLRGLPFGIVEREEARRLKEYEPKISRAFDLNLVASSLDKRYLEELGAANLSLLENGVDCPAELGEETCNIYKMTIFANFRSFPNIDAFFYFYREIFPLVRKKIRSAALNVVGANIPRSMMRIKDPAVSMHPDPNDIKALVKEGCVSAAPMRAAAGIQNKILQSMAWGIPVVATSIGLGGLSFKPSEDLLVADSPGDFSEKIIRLMNDHILRDRIRRQAFSSVKKGYQWSDIVKGLEERLHALY